MENGNGRPERIPDAGREGNGAGQLLALRILTDVLAVVLSFVLAYEAYHAAIGAGWLVRAAPAPEPYVGILGVFVGLTLLVFARQGLYRGRSTVLNLWELETAVKGVLLAAALLFALLFLLNLESYSRYVVVGSIGLSIVFVLLERRLLSALVRRLQLRGAIGRRTLIYGCGKTGQLLMKKILESSHLGSVVVGFLDDHVPLGSRVCCRITQTDPRLFEAPVMGRLEDLPVLVGRERIDEVFVVESALGPERQREVVETCEELGVEVAVVPSLGDIRSDQLLVEDLSAIPVLRPARPAARRLGPAVKRAFDLVASVVLLVAFSPVLALAAALIRLESPGPALFSQQRIGLDGHPFRVHKFRTMRGDAPPYASSPPGDVDPNITRVGRILRKTGLDELPQLLNVLKGEMSLVGPRPEMPHLVQGYGPVERQRLTVKPGITGLWQLSADRHAEIHENIEYDLYYVNHQSFLLDTLVLLETAFFTFGVLFGHLDRRPARRQPEGPPDIGPTPEAAEEYVLVALDQRGDGGLPGTWAQCVPAAYAISERWPVRIVVAEGNREALDELLKESIARLGADGHRTTFAPYRSRSELRRLTLEARLVVTDLPHVGSWTDEADVDLLTVEDGGVRWWPRSRVPDPIVSDLSRFLTVWVGPAERAGTRESSRRPSVISMTGS